MSQEAEKFRIFGHEGPYKECMGLYSEVYTETRGGVALRSVYKHTRLPVYLYFHEKDKTWALSNKIGSSRCWMFASDLAQKPHLIIGPWKYINPNDRKWLLESKMKCEPHIELKDGGNSSRRESMKVQIKAMESVIEAMKTENKKLREQIKLARLPHMVAQVSELRSKNLAIREKRFILEEKLKDLDIRKKECDNLQEEKKRLETETRQLLARITAQKRARAKVDCLLPTGRNFDVNGVTNTTPEEDQKATGIVSPDILVEEVHQEDDTDCDESV